MTVVERHLPRTPQHRRAVSRKWAIGAGVVVVLVTVGTRLAYLLSGRDRFNGDEAVTGVVVKQILHGHWYVFFPGQQYGGTGEEYLQALAYWLLPLPQDRLTLRFVQLALSATTCALIYACARRMSLRPTQAVFPALLFAVGPWYNVQNGAMTMSFYTLSQTLSIAGLYFAMRFDSDSRSLHWPFFVGLVCGLGYWNALITAYTLIPTLIWLVPILIRRARAALSLILGAVVGAAPLYPWMLSTHHLIPRPYKDVAISLTQRFHNLAGPVLREFIGFGITDGPLQPGLPVWLLRFIEVALVVGSATLFWRRRHGLMALVRMRIEDRSAIDVALIALPVTVALYCSSTSAVWITDPKYLVSAYPLFFLAVAAMLPVERKALYASLALLIVVVSSTLCLRYWLHPEWQISKAGLAGQSTLPDSRSRDAQLKKAIDYLVHNGETAAYSDYWTAMPAKYLAGDRLTVGVLYGRERFPQVEPTLRVAPNIEYIIDTRDADSKNIPAVLREHHINFHVHRFGPTIEVLDHVGRGGRPEQIGLLPVNEA